MHTCRRVGGEPFWEDGMVSCVLEERDWGSGARDEAWEMAGGHGVMGI